MEILQNIFGEVFHMKIWLFYVLIFPLYELINKSKISLNQLEMMLEEPSRRKMSYVSYELLIALVPMTIKIPWRLLSNISSSNLLLKVLP